MDHRGSLIVQLDRLWVLGTAGAEVLPAERWRRLLTCEVEALLEELSGRFAFEERDGYLKPMVRERPELLASVDRLRDEHEKILGEMSSLVALAQSAELEAARERLKELVRRIRHHEHAEIALIQTATLTDVGVVD